MQKFNFWLLGILAICLIFSAPFVLKGRIPIPADTILGMYHPWRDKVWDNFTAGVPFKNFLITDPVRQQYVWKKLAIESFKKRELPLWNPYTHSGMPLLANFQTGAFYPLNLLFFLFEFNFAWGVYILLQPLLASVFMFFFLKELKLANFASFFGGIVFAFSGFLTAWFEWGNLGHTALWLPLILLSIEKIVKKSLFLTWGIVFVFSLSASFFAGHLQTFFYLFLFSLFYLVWKIYQKRISFQKKLKLFSLFTVYCLLFTLITAIQWLPTRQLIKLSSREIDQVSLINQSGWFLPFKHLIQFIAPDFFGNPVTMNYWGEWNYGELVGYVGIVPLVFSLAAILGGIKKRISLLHCFIVSLLIAFLFILPTPLAKLPFLLKIPFISTAQPTRLLFIVDFCLAVLAAFGVNKFTRAWQNPDITLGECQADEAESRGKHADLMSGRGFIKDQKSFKHNLRITVYGLLFTILIFWFFAFSKNLTVTQRNLILPTGILCCFILFNFLFIFFKRRKFPNFILHTSYFILLISLTIFDLIRFSWKFNPFVKRDWIFPETRVIEFLQQDKSLWRMMTLDRRIFPPNFSAIYHLETIEGYDPLYLRDYGCLVTKMEGGEEMQSCGAFNRIIRPVNFTSELVDTLNVKYILSLEEISHPKLEKVFQEGKTRVYENLKVKPRVEISNGEIKKVDYQENKVRIEVISEQEAELILRDFYYPGWEAEIDGQNSEVLKTEDGLRKILVPAGEHQVCFKFSLR